MIRELRWAILCICVVAAVHLAALVLVLTHTDVIRDALANTNPDITSTRLDDLAQTQVVSSVVPHILLPLLLLWRAYRLRQGRPSSRIWITVLLVIQLLAHATLPMVLAVLPGYEGWVIAVQAFSLVFELATLWLLWVPAPMRALFRRRTPIPA